MLFDKLTQPIDAGGIWRLGLAANDLQIVSAAWPLRVTLYKGGAVIGAASSVLAGDYFRGVDFDLVEFSSDIAQTVTVLLSDGTSGSNRTTGEVSVINGEVARVRSGKCFSGVAALAGVVGSYSMCQLFNPAGSGKNLILTKVSVRADAAGVYITDSVDPLTTDISTRIRSKLVGGAAGVAQLRYQAIATFNGAYRYMNASTVGTKNTIEIPFAEPIVIPPGNSILTGLDATGLSNDSTFQWTEEDI